MKLVKILVLPIFMAAVFFSCKKTGNTEDIGLSASDVTVKDGIVTFKSIAAYLAVAENKNGEQSQLAEKLKAVNFKSLKSNAESVAPITSAASSNSIAIITNAFNPALYSDYLLSILNTDKICSINGFWVKVDMDNIFCSAIDVTLYPNGYNDLKNNAFTNSNIMTFTNANEPVIDVLGGIRNNTLTWASYQSQLAQAKGGGGICFGSGRKSEYSGNPKYLPNGAVIGSSVWYSKEFIHFELGFEAYVNGNGIFDRISVSGSYQYEGVCKGSGLSIIYWPPNTWYRKQLVYSGGSALKIGKIQITPTAVINGPGLKSSIGY